MLTIMLVTEPVLSPQTQEIRKDKRRKRTRQKRREQRLKKVQQKASNKAPNLAVKTVDFSPEHQTVDIGTQTVTFDDYPPYIPPNNSADGYYDCLQGEVFYSYHPVDNIWSAPASRLSAMNPKAEPWVPKSPSDEAFTPSAGDSIGSKKLARYVEHCRRFV